MSAAVFNLDGEKIEALDDAGRTYEPDAFAKLPADQKLRARDRGIRTKASKKARDQALAELPAQIDRAVAIAQNEHVSELDRASKRERAIGYHQAAWHFGIGAFAVGIAASALLIFTMQGVIWDTAARSFREQAMTGALLSGQAPAERP